jgi:hypothetical protein
MIAELVSRSATISHFKHTGSLQCPQELATGPYPEPAEFNPHAHSFKMHHNVISTLRPVSKAAPSLQNFELKFRTHVLHVQNILSS